VLERGLQQLNLLGQLQTARAHIIKLRSPHLRVSVAGFVSEIIGVLADKDAPTGRL
jgi:hypothetical protein